MMSEAVGQEVVSWACDVLVSGATSDAVLALAALPFDVTMVEAEPLFHRATVELGLPPMPRREAGWLLAATVARQMIEDTIPAHVGAGILWGLWWDLGNPAEVSALVEVLDAWEVALPKDQPTIDNELRQLAPAVLDAAKAALR